VGVKLVISRTGVGLGVVTTSVGVVKQPVKVNISTNVTRNKIIDSLLLNKRASTIVDALLLY
jgi:hypothetical protein